MKKSGVVYIYNPKQANFYINEGVEILETGVNPTTNKIWYKFGFEDSEIAYSKWCNRKK